MSAEFVYQQGIHLQDSVLWLDAVEPRPFCFVSDGHARRLPRHGRVLATPATVRFCRVRMGAGDALIAPYNRPFTLGKLRLELLPGGSMLGSAQLFIERDNERIVYAGYLGPLDGLETAIRPQVRRCHTLVLNTPPHLVDRCATRDQARGALLEAIAETRRKGQTPVILCEPVGMAQEITAWCQSCGLEVRSHRTIASFTADYRRFGAMLMSTTGYRGGDIEADVLIFPRLLANSPTLLDAGPVRFIIPSSSGQRHNTDPDGAIYVDNVTSHATVEELETYARCSQVDQVVVAGPSWQPVLHALRKAGISATALRAPKQGRLFTS